MKLSECNEKMAKEAISLSEITLLPLGAVEPHGNHLPLATDNILAERFAERLDSMLGPRSILLPTFPFGQVWSLAGYAGALDIGANLLSSLLIRLAENMASYGIYSMAIINSHYGNFDAIKTAARTLAKQNINLLSFTWYNTKEVINELRESKAPHNSFMHADEIETSLMLSIAPEWVDMTQARAHYPKFPNSFEFEPIPWTAFSDYSVLGDPCCATQEKGGVIIDKALQETFAAIVFHLEKKNVKS